MGRKFLFSLNSILGCLLLGSIAAFSQAASSTAANLHTEKVVDSIAQQVSADSSKVDAPKSESSKADSLKKESPKKDETKETKSEKNKEPAKKIKVTKKKLPTLSAEQEKLSAKINSVLDHYYKKHLDTSSRSPWAIMHAIVAYGVDTEVYRGGQGGPKVTAIGWLTFNRPANGQTLFGLDGNGRLTLQEGPGVQGHPGQLLAILAQSRLKSDYPVRVQGKKFTIKDIIEYEKRTCRAGTELTFKLIALSHYLKTDATWKSDSGEKWSLARLIQEELKQPVVGAACGGTHRMTGFSYALHKRKAQGGKITGQWKRAQTYVNDFHKYTFRLQNIDGSFSTNFFERRGADSGLAIRLWSTGHTLEWLMMSLSKEEVKDPRVTKAVVYLTEMLENNPNRTWKVGPLGHALHALALYDQRMFKRWESPLSREATKQTAKKKADKTSDSQELKRIITTRIANRSKIKINILNRDKKTESGPALFNPSK